MAMEQQQDNTAEELQEATRAEKEPQKATTTAEKTLEKPAEVSQEAELEWKQPSPMRCWPRPKLDKPWCLSRPPLLALGLILPCANIVKLENNGVTQSISAALGPVVPQVEAEIFSICAAQGPIISLSANQDLDSSSGSDFKEVASLPLQDDLHHVP
ncbi:hypothetical protein KR018_003842 [Drosophila ironensis]|nr:hypothetical protein KR018_003842 [Drosophila ironensis]